MTYSAVQGQNNIQAKEQNLSNGIIIELSTDQISAESKYLFITDSSSQKFSLGEIAIGSQNIWTKQSNSPVDRPDVVHWYFDEDSRLVQVDISNVKELLDSGTNAEIKLLAIGSRKLQYSFAIFESSSDYTSRQDLKKINQVEINLK
jgi:hypothetical protein